MMHRPFVILCMTLVCCANTIAQNNGLVINGKWADQVSISDVNGRPFENKYADVNGTPYFNAIYKSANIKLTQGRMFANVKTRIDLAAQETYFICSNGAEAYLEPGMIKEITYADTTAGGIILYKFQTGFPSIDKQNQYNFYLVLAEGRCSLIKSIIKTVAERKNELSGEIAKDFETSENYYLFANGEMKRLKKEKSFILAALSDKQGQADQFIQSNKINLKNTDHLVKLLNYYNSL
jgi:hydroxymethylpyrimidine pyrophosphatase-like HAD family hydrolase